MNDKESSLTTAFHTAAQHLLGFLVTEYNFALRTSDISRIVYDSSAYRIRVYLEREGVVTSIQPVGSTPNCEAPKEIGLKVLIQCLDGQTIDNQYFGTPTPARIQEELARSAELLKEYCQNILQGDYSRWSSIQKCADERVQILQEQSERRIAKLKALRETGEILWLQKDYAQVVLTYEAMKPYLTTVEQERLAIALGQIGEP